MNDVVIDYPDNNFIVKDNIYELSSGFNNFLTSRLVIYDDIEEDETIIKMFLKDIKYDIGKGDKMSSRYRTIKRILGIKDGVLSKVINSTEAGSLIERLELLILEIKAGHDVLYDEMLNKSKQLLSLNITNQKQLDNFVFNFGK